MPLGDFGRLGPSDFEGFGVSTLLAFAEIRWLVLLAVADMRIASSFQPQRVWGCRGAVESIRCC